MSRFEKFERWFFGLYGLGKSTEQHLRIYIPEHRPGLQTMEEAQEILAEWSEAGLISMWAWDGERPKPFDEWANKAEFFESPFERGYIRIRLRVRGKAHAESLDRETIGFVA
jgi:hypothetical protein